MTGLPAPVASLLETHLGLAPAAVSGRAIEAAVRRRMAATATADSAAYLALVKNDRRELDELVEAVVVPETWFFRYPESFRHLAVWATARHPTAAHPLRVLSVPCSTGEEPYSIAIALLTAGMPAGAFRVTAVDVCRRAVEATRAGVYGASAFREPDTSPRTDSFDSKGNLFTVRDEVRRIVTSRTGNLADPAFLAGEGPFDTIFCRNLFIYLTPAARRTAVATLDRLLAPGGVVYMGHAEPLGLAGGRFHGVSPPAAFAFTRSSVRPSDPTPIMAAPLPMRHGGLPLPDDEQPLADSAASPSLLVRARVAADAGRTTDATRLAEQSLLEGPSADAFALLGVVREMTGDTAAAEQCFTRALYLDPAHFDALIHMMALADGRGDVTAAANYRRRAARRRTRP